MISDDMGRTGSITGVDVNLKRLGSCRYGGNGWREDGGQRRKERWKGLITGVDGNLKRLGFCSMKEMGGGKIEGRGGRGGRD
jgi:hypothetical protein